MTDFLDEVQEFHKQESISKFLHKYTKFIIGVSILIVLVSGSYVYYQNYQESKQSRHSENYYTVFEKNDLKGIQKLSEENAEGFSDFAALNYSYILEQKGQNKDAFEKYKSLIKNSNYVEIVNYAIYKAGMIALKQNDKNMLKEYVYFSKEASGSAFKELVTITDSLISYQESKNKSQVISSLNKIKSDSKDREIIEMIESLITKIKN
ncbi:MAG: tetratricopeptide repeat protein [Rickettsiales bacterium]